MRIALSGAPHMEFRVSALDIGLENPRACPLHLGALFFAGCGQWYSFEFDDKDSLLRRRFASTRTRAALHVGAGHAAEAK